MNLWTRLPPWMDNNYIVKWLVMYMNLSSMGKCENTVKMYCIVKACSNELGSTPDVLKVDSSIIPTHVRVWEYIKNYFKHNINSNWRRRGSSLPKKKFSQSENNVHILVVMGYDPFVATSLFSPHIHHTFTKDSSKKMVGCSLSPVEARNDGWMLLFLCMESCACSIWVWEEDRSHNFTKGRFTLRCGRPPVGQ